MLHRDEAIRLLRAIVALSGATIIESDGSSSVEIQFPSDIAVVPAQPKQPSSSGRFRVLHVEDVDRASDLIYYYLRNKYDVDTEQNAENAFKTAMVGHYDFILMDLNLGKGMNGFDLTELLRKTEQYAKVPIVVVSGYTSRKNVDRSIAAGCNAFLSKPFLKDDLLRLLHQLEVKLGLSPSANSSETERTLVSDGTAKATHPVSAPLVLDGLAPTAE